MGDFSPLFLFYYLFIEKMETIKKITSWGYLIKLNIRLEDKEQKNFDILKKLKKPVFSVCADVWYKGREDMGGQCLDEINEILEKNWDLTKERAIIYYLRKKHHLNDLHAGTEKQEKYLKEHLEEHKRDYSKSCEVLEKAGILYDGDYKYWSSWLYREIPAEDLAEIKKFFIK